MNSLVKIFNDFQLEFAIEYIRNYAHLSYSNLEKNFERTNIPLDDVLDSITEVTSVRLWNSYDRDSFFDTAYLAIEGMIQEGVSGSDVKTLRERIEGSFRDDQLEYEITFKSLIGDDKALRTLDQVEVNRWLEELFDEWERRYK